MKPILLFLILALSQPAAAQIFLADSNAAYFQDFNTLDSFGTAAINLPPGWTFQEWGSAANASYRAGTGSLNASDTYSFGAAQSRDRALGSLASGTLTRIQYGSMFINHSGSDINAVSICYKGEQWRRGGSGAPDSLRFYFSTVPGLRPNDSTASGWTEVPALLFRSVSTLSGSAALNGNDSCRVLQATLPLMLHPGDTLRIRWCDLNAAGSDDGLAIDSLSLRFQNGTVTQGNHPRLTGFSPDSSSAGLTAAPDLHLFFDRAVRAGTGKLYIRHHGSGRIDTLDAQLAQPRGRGAEMVFGAVPLTTGEAFTIRFDSTAFDSLGFASGGLYDSSWTFRIALLQLGIPFAPASALGVEILGDGRIIVRPESDGAPEWQLSLAAMDGRTLRQETYRTAGAMLLNPQLPRGGCYVLALRQGRSELRRLLCLP